MHSVPHEMGGRLLLSVVWEEGEVYGKVASCFMIYGMAKQTLYICPVSCLSWTAAHNSPRRHLAPIILGELLGSGTGDPAQVRLGSGGRNGLTSVGSPREWSHEELCLVSCFVAAVGCLNVPARFVLR